MKKLCFVFAAVMTIFTILFLSGCKPAPDGLSERRSGFFYAEDEVFKITAVSGIREEPYAADGVVGTTVEYTLITVAPTDEKAFDPDAVLTYNATVVAEPGEKRFGGGLTAHPFAASYSAEYAFETTADMITLTVKWGETTREYTLKTQVTPEMLTYDKAVSVCKKELAPSGVYETRAKLIRNPIGDGLCWHVEFCSGDAVVGALIDPLTAKVLAKKG